MATKFIIVLCHSIVGTSINLSIYNYKNPNKANSALTWISYQSMEYHGQVISVPNGPELETGIPCQQDFSGFSFNLLVHIQPITLSDTCVAPQLPLLIQVE